MDLRTLLMVVAISSAIGIIVTLTFQTVTYTFIWRRDYGVWPWNDNWLKNSIKSGLHNLKKRPRSDA